MSQRSTPSMTAPSKALVFGTAYTLRLLCALAFPQLADLLSTRAEISTPTNSFKRLREGLYLYERGLDPYDGGVYRQAPLLLPFFSLILPSEKWLADLIGIAVFAGFDMGIADCLFEIAASGVATKTRHHISPRAAHASSPITIAAVYLFNPFTLLVCLGKPTSLLTTFFIALSIKHACEGKVKTSSMALASASYLGFHPVVLVAPVALLCYQQAKSNVLDRSKSSVQAFVLQFTLSFGISATLLVGASRLLMPTWRFVPAILSAILELPDLTPNVGIWWYFFIEMFDAFRSFFLGVFWFHIVSYSIPLCLRLSKQPLSAVVIMLGIVAVFEPYANIGDVGFWLSSLCLLSHVFDISSRHRYTFPALAALLYAMFLGPAFHHLWIYAGSGNANFFYAITLVWSLALLILLTDTLFAVLRDEWELERPEGKGKETRQL